VLAGLRGHRPQLEALAQALLDNETLDRGEIDAILADARVSPAAGDGAAREDSGNGADVGIAPAGSERAAEAGDFEAATEASELRPPSGRFRRRSPGPTPAG
jgi:hypothetical protein